jgi:dihydrofolate reductase
MNNMRKIIVQEFITLDGVMQAPGGQEEDASNDFKYGGWTAPYFDDADQAAGDFMKKWMESTDILLGQTTFELFADFWPKHADMWPGIIDVNKYVLSDTMTEDDVKNSGWDNSVLLKSVDELKKLKDSDGPAIKVHGSSKVAQTLFENDMVDELCLMTFPVVLGKGKRLFDERSLPRSFVLTDSLITPNGVVFTYFKRGGEVKTGTVGA